MKKFNTIFQALKEVKKIANECAEHKKYRVSIYLMNDYYQENYYVTDEVFDITSYLEENFDTDVSPDSWADEHNIIMFEFEDSMKDYPFLLSSYKKSVIKSSRPLIRKKIYADVDYSVSFNIS